MILCSNPLSVCKQGSTERNKAARKKERNQATVVICSFGEPFVWAIFVLTQIGLK